MDPARTDVRVAPDAGRMVQRAGAPPRVGRDGLLHLRFVERDACTRLVSRRCRAPLQVLEPLYLASDGSAFAVLLNPGGGILGGDHLHTEIDAGPGAHVGIATPSATKVYRCLGAPAVQHTSIQVGEAAVVEYVPHHLIPHAGAALEQALHVNLQPRSRLILYDGIALGRLARGESWAFRSLASEIRVTDEGGPLYWDRLRLTPEHAPGLGALGGSEGYGYLGTMAFCEPARPDWGEMLEATRELLAGLPDLRGGASLLARGGILVKVLAGSAHALTAFAGQAWALGRRHLLRRPPLDLRL